MDPIQIDVHGLPIPKARPRVTRRGTYTPTRSKAWEDEVSWAAKQVMKGRKPMTECFYLSLAFRFEPPVSWPKWKRKAALAQRIGMSVTPDLDNLFKSIADSLNDIVWDDDCQIVRVSMIKHYGPKPGVSILAHPLEGFYPVQTVKREDVE